MTIQSAIRAFELDKVNRSLSDPKIVNCTHATLDIARQPLPDDLVLAEIGGELVVNPCKDITGHRIIGVITQLGTWERL
jgi:hypothetical protein